MLATLPSDIRQHAREVYKRFSQNPDHPSLHLKKVHPNRPIYSVRVSMNYRAIGELDRNDMIWFWIGPHGEYGDSTHKLKHGETSAS